MRKALSLVIIATIGLMLGGCTGVFNTAYIKRSEIKHSKVFDVEVKPEQKVGRRDIKFYVDKVKDSREYKGVFTGKGFGLNFHHAFAGLEDFSGTVKDITNKALYETGWGVAKSKNDATYIINMDIKKLAYRIRLADFLYTADAKICVYNNSQNKLVVSGEPKVFRRLISPMDIDLADGKWGVVIRNLRYFYTSLLNFFSSKAFVDAVENGRQHIDSSVDCSFALDNSTK